MSSNSIVTSRRRVEIQSTSEMTPYFTMTKCNNCLLHTLLAQLNAYQVFHRVFQPFYLLGERSEPHTAVQSRFRVMYICMYVYMYVGMSSIVYGKQYKQIVC